MCADNVSRVCCWEITFALYRVQYWKWVDKGIIFSPLNLYLTPAWWGIGCWEKECSVESSQAVLWPVCRSQCCYSALPGCARWSTLLKPGYRLWSWRWATFLYRTIISSCTVLALVDFSVASKFCFLMADWWAKVLKVSEVTNMQYVYKTLRLLTKDYIKLHRC